MTQAIMTERLVDTQVTVDGKQKRALDELAGSERLTRAVARYEENRSKHLPISLLVPELRKVSERRLDAPTILTDGVRVMRRHIGMMRALGTEYLAFLEVQGDDDLDDRLSGFKYDLGTISGALNHEANMEGRRVIEREMFSRRTPESERRSWRAMHFFASQHVERMMYTHLSAKVKRFEELLYVDKDRAVLYMSVLPKDVKGVLVALRNLDGENGNAIDEVILGTYQGPDVQVDPARIAEFIEFDGRVYRQLIGEFSVQEPPKRVRQEPAPKPAEMIELPYAAPREPSIQDNNYEGLRAAVIASKNGIAHQSAEVQSAIFSHAIAYGGCVPDCEVNDLRKNFRRFKFAGNRHHFAIFLERVEGYITEKRTVPDLEWMKGTEGEVLKLGTERAYQHRA